MGIGANHAMNKVTVNSTPISISQLLEGTDCIIIIIKIYLQLDIIQ